MSSLSSATLALLTSLSSFSSVPGPAPNTELPFVETGDVITIATANPEVPPLPCGITVLSGKRAVTAGHCGAKGAAVSKEGIEIGVISDNLLTSGKGYDIAVIEIAEGVTTLTAEVSYDFLPEVADRVLQVGGVSKSTTGKVIDPVLRNRDVPLYDGGTYPATVWTAKLEGEPGDSGAPVYMDGVVIGIVEGGNLEKKTIVSPIPADLKS
ncbi:S1 family peptidase [Corynebacterium cystitidis]|uniref:S1 family peptidase n=1 Tax=Corynebacterium cystitidis TaxID=35757 RepID=UPI00211DFECF|nr:S1 family peptidase [Corynebacterium cystitidis]